MAIRLRKAKKGYVALCAVESKHQQGDVYLDDSIDYALSLKYFEDFKKMGFIKEEKK